MVISHAHRYIFLEIPRTGSTAISAELMAHYAGKKVLHKHANYFDLPQEFRDRGYFVFAGVRNPVDNAASNYQKLKTNHGGVYTDSKHFIENGGWVDRKTRKLYRLVQSGSSFAEFVKHSYPVSYCSRISINKKYCDRIIRQEHLQADFSAVLECIGIPQVRGIPLRNQTRGKRRYVDYCDEIPGLFSPFMREWGYEVRQPGVVDRLKYHLLKTAAAIYFRLPRRVPSEQTMSLHST